MISSTSRSSFDVCTWLMFARHLMSFARGDNVFPPVSFQLAEIQRRHLLPGCIGRSFGVGQFILQIPVNCTKYLQNSLKKIFPFTKRVVYLLQFAPWLQFEFHSFIFELTRHCYMITCFGLVCRFDCSSPGGPFEKRHLPLHSVDLKTHHQFTLNKVNNQQVSTFSLLSAFFLISSGSLRQDLF